MPNYNFPSNYGFTDSERELARQMKSCRQLAKLPFLTKKTALVILALFIIIFGFIRFTIEQNKVQQAAYDRYDQCVERVYGTSAAEFYQVYGHIANCK